LKTPSKKVKPSKKPAATRAASITPSLHHSTAPTLTFANHQRTKPLNRALLKEITLATLTELNITHWDLTFYFVSAPRMAEINEAHMGHPGPTDVITFDYSEHATRNTQHAPSITPPATRHPSPTALFGEIFICVDIAVVQAREFRTTWQSEVVRYIVHSLLHLCGYDDLNPTARREMKRQENRIVRKLDVTFAFSKISSPQLAKR